MQKHTLAAFALSALLVPGAALAQSNGNGNGRAYGQRDREQMRFAEMDTDNDGVITRAEWRGNVQSFREHDLNHDNVLSGNEVWPGDGVNRRDGSSREETMVRFDRADRNGDGRVARSEWTGTTAAFKRMDENGDGIVSREEFLAMAVNGPVATSGVADPRNTTRAYQTGYERGRTEGRQAGKEDKGVNGGHWDLEGQRELEQADSGYTADLGARSDYQSGYRAGFRLGYGEGFGPR